MHAQFAIVFFHRLDRNLANMLPGFAVNRIAVLKFGGNHPRGFLGCRILLAADIGLFVKTGNLRNVVSFHLVQAAVGGDHFRQNHTDRGSPVAEMNIGDRFVADKFFNPAHRFADHSRTQVPDMHFLGNVRPAVIHYHGFRIFLQSAAETFVGCHLVQHAGQKFVGQGQVEEPRAVNRNPGKIFVLAQTGGNFFADLTGVFLFAFGQRQRTVALKVA